MCDSFRSRAKNKCAYSISHVNRDRTNDLLQTPKKESKPQKPQSNICTKLNCPRLGVEGEIVTHSLKNRYSKHISIQAGFKTECILILMVNLKL